MKTFFAFVILTIGMTSNVSWAGYEWFTNPANGHEYALTGYGPWAACEAEAVAQGGHLVTINDPAEYHWLLDDSNPLCSSYAMGYTGVLEENASWIGMYYDGVGDIHSLDSWRWLTGEVGSDFLVPAPSFYGFNGIHMHLAGTYNPECGMITNAPNHDLNPDCYLQGVIEVVPEPATLSLLALGVLTLFRKRKP